MSKYVVLLKYPNEEIQRYEFDTMDITASFLDLSVNQLRERMSWYASGLTKNVWHRKLTGISYQVFKNNNSKRNYE
jgi:hypothetical protein